MELIEITSAILFSFLCNLLDPNNFKIIDGDVVTTGFEFVVEVERNDLFYCTGVIVGKKWILAAAHCKELGDSDTDFSVRVGSKYRGRGELYRVFQTFTMEGYHPYFYTNDLILFELYNNIDFASTKFPSSIIPTSKTPASRENIYEVAGWGMVNDHSYPFGLLKTDVNIIPIAECNRRFHLYYTEVNLCATNTAHPTAPGDSGAPYVRADSTGKYILYGIHSMGFSDASRPYIMVNIAHPKAQEFLSSHIID